MSINIVGNLTTRAVSKVGTFFAALEKFTLCPKIASHSVAPSREIYKGHLKADTYQEAQCRVTSPAE
jgi:hypothetical protein